jgi:hypothetical protein
LTSLWLNEARNDFQWNTTRSLDWSPIAPFIGIAASPQGELYGIQGVSNASGTQYWAYNFSFATGSWNLFDQSSQIKDVKFDKLGNMYILDPAGNLYAANSPTTPILTGIKDFGVTTQH